MSLNKYLQSSAVVGAAGKMGKGISLLLLQEIARIEAAATGAVGNGQYRLILVDTNMDSHVGLKKYLRTQVTKYAEKNINSLRKWYENNLKLVSNEEIVRAFVEGSLDIVQMDSEIDSIKDSCLVFEAIVEDIEAKSQLYTTLKRDQHQQQYYFTNTSSIPVSLLDQKCQLEHRIIGFHFYNPPAIQKLLEIISPTSVDPFLYEMAEELAKRLGKIVVHAHDKAGFIGNGHFIRELLFACQEARRLAQNTQISLEQAIYLVDRIVQSYLMRPMGIFQVADYVGIDVCHHIVKIMRECLPDATLFDPLLDAMVLEGILGGQHPDGSQKNGFFQYQQQEIVGVYSLERHTYQPLSKMRWNPESEQILHTLSAEKVSWKSLQRDPNKKEKLLAHYERLSKETTAAALLATRYKLHSSEIAESLVETGVADRLEDVQTVLKHGFFHEEE